MKPPTLLLVFLVLELQHLGFGLLPDPCSDPDGEVLTAPAVIESPNYPQRYPSFADCQWRVISDQPMTVSFTLMSIEYCDRQRFDFDSCLCDYLEIEDGDLELARFCGLDIPQTFVSSTNEIIFRLRSDYSVENFGFVINITTPGVGGTGHTCISSCDSRPDGKYQSCATCSGYILCDGETLEEKKCNGANTWDDDKKKCSKQASTTCTETPEDTTTTTTTTATSTTSTTTAVTTTAEGTGTGHTCISSCDSRPDGKYQSCATCSGYILCDGETLEEKKCNGANTWDDDKKKCSKQASTTCTETPEDTTTTTTTTATSTTSTTTALTTRAEGTGDVCVTSCSGLSDGRYQDCYSCAEFIVCQGEVMQKARCRFFRLYDDVKKTCKKTSNTCTPLAPTTPVSGPSSGASCIWMCGNKSDGKYQLCASCTTFAACKYGRMKVKNCRSRKTWNDDAKTCQRGASPTCSISK